MQRREFIRRAAATAAAAPLLIATARAAELISAADPTAVALRYVEDGSTAQRPDKMGVPGAEQVCSNCRFYADPAAEQAGCSLFRNQHVPGKAWCAGWVNRG